MSDATVPDSVMDKLSPMTKNAVRKLNDDQKMYFVEQYQYKRKDSILMLVLSIIFPIQLFLLGKTGLGVAYLLTGGGCGIWWIIEIFMAIPRTNEYNGELAARLLQEAKILHENKNE